MLLRSMFHLSRGLMLCAILCCPAVTHAQNAEKPLDVIVQAVSSHNLQNNIEALGNLRANESTVLTAKVTKTVTRINFEDGQRVKKNAILVAMTNAEEAALMDEARLTADEAKKQLERVQALSKAGAVSPSLLDQRAREYDTAQAHFLSLEARYNDLFIRAPFDGVIGLRNVSVGSLIAPGQVITTINDDSKMKLDFTVPAVYLRNLRKGLPIEANSYDLGDKIFKGEVFSIDNQVDEVTRSIKVRAVLDNPKQELKQGLLMTVVLRADMRNALVISESALVPMGSNNFVFVLKKNNDSKGSQWIAENRQIQIGQRYKGEVEVLSGLNEGDKVVTHGLQKIHSGQPVNILSEQSNESGKAPEHLSELLQKKPREAK